jgi:hypothetical protein
MYTVSDVQFGNFSFEKNRWTSLLPGDILNSVIVNVMDKYYYMSAFPAICFPRGSPVHRSFRALIKKL